MNAKNDIFKVIGNHVRKTRSCWLWNKNLRDDGYARVSWHGTMLYAHRVIYETLVGPIPAGMELDHKCRIRHCVNPEHLEPVTHRENTLRGDTIPANNARKKRCIHGHLFSGRNLIVTKRNKRRCRTCKNNARRKVSHP